MRVQTHCLSWALSEDLCLADIKVEVSIFFENGRQHGYDLEGFRKFRDDVVIVGVSQAFNLWKFPKNATPEVESNETKYHKLWAISLKSVCSASDIIFCPIV